jgi:aryl-alcohol dehydrogenase-like predicted oxidoreductase
MEYRTFDDWRLSVIGYGCYGLSGAYGPVDEKKFSRTITAAFEQGINFFDTAEGYGGAEAFLGKVTAPFRDQVYIATKLSGESGSPDLSFHAVHEACEASLERLNMEVVDLYQIHFDDPQTPILETITALEELVKQGKIRKYGLCHLSLDNVKDYAELGNPFSVLMELSPVARTSLTTLLPVCQKHQMAGLAFSVTGRGILSGRYNPGYEFEQGDIRRIDPLFKRERFESAMRIRDELAKAGVKYDATAVQMAVAWVLAQPQIVCALTGTSSLDHLAENIAASEIDLDEDDLGALNNFLDEEDQRLASLQERTLKRLLNDPLDNDPQKAFEDLVYVLETAIINGMVRESEVVPAFKELFALRKDLDDKAKRRMAGIQNILRDRIFPGKN